MARGGGLTSPSPPRQRQFTAYVFNPGNVGFDVRSLSMNTYYTFVNTKNELDGFKISPDSVVRILCQPRRGSRNAAWSSQTDLGNDLDVYVPNRETVAVRICCPPPAPTLTPPPPRVQVHMRLNVTALISSQLLQSMQRDCAGEDQHLKCVRHRKAPATRLIPPPALNPARFTFFGDGDAGWYGSFGGQSFSINVESKTGCSRIERADG